MRATPRWLTALAMALVLVVVLSSFALSFTVLRDLAALSGIPGDVAWLWPVIVDGTITAATLVLYTVRGTGRRQALPVATLLLFGLASVIGNISHILLVDPSRIVPVVIAVFVGVMPPVGLILTVELLGSLLRSREHVSVTALTAAPEQRTLAEPGSTASSVLEDDEVITIAVSTPDPSPVSTSVLTPERVPVVEDTVSVPESPLALLHAAEPIDGEPAEDVPAEKAEQVAWIVEQARADRDVTREALAARLGVSVRTAQRRLAEARIQDPDAFEAAAPTAAAHV